MKVVVLGLALVLWGVESQADEAQVIHLKQKFSIQHAMPLPAGFGGEPELKQLKQELTLLVRVDAFEICRNAFSAEDFIAFKPLNEVPSASEQGVLTVIGEYECALNMSKPEVKYFLPGLLEGLADGRDSVHRLSLEILKEALKVEPAWREEIRSYYATLSPIVKYRLVELGLGSAPKPQAEGTDTSSWPMKTLSKFPYRPEMSPDMIRAIERYLREQVSSELAESCATLSGGIGKIEKLNLGKLVKGDQTNPFSLVSGNAKCNFRVESETLTQNLRTLLSLYRFRNWEVDERRGYYLSSGLSVSDSSFWVTELSEQIALSSGSRAMLIQLIAGVPLKSASRMAVLEAIRPYFDWSSPLFEPVEDLLKTWKADSLIWLEEKLKNKQVPADRTALYLSVWGANEVPLRFVELLATYPEATGGVISILDSRVFDGSEGGLFKFVLKICEAAVDQRFADETSMRVIGKFKNRAAFPVLNRGLLVGGLHLSKSAQPLFVEATLEGITFLSDLDGAKNAFPNLKKVAEKYYDQAVRKKAQELLAKLGG